MDYKKMYEQAIKRAKAMIPVAANQEEIYNSVITIFPELAESEDERVRKELISFFTERAKHTEDSTFNGLSSKCILAWLEKQGTPAELSEEEQNRFAKGVLTSCALSFINYLDAHKYEGKMCVSNGECEDIENAFHNAMWDKLHRYYCKYIEKQSEKPQGKSALEAAKEEKIDNQNCVNPTDKIEPKFHEGEWITSDDDYTWKVTAIKALDYVLQSQAGDIVDCTISYADKHFHLWTIQDAKDGDLLATKTGGVFIYEELLYDKPFAYCGVDKFGVFKDCNCGDGLDWTPYLSEVTPATKEQRELLFQKMHEAGYEWDADKKELNKIEQKPTNLAKGEDYGIDGLYNAIRILEKTLGKVDGYQTDDGILEHECAISAVKKLYEQKHAWSEEDERLFQIIIDILDKEEHKGHLSHTDLIACVRKLKSLKEKVQPQTTWRPNDKQIVALRWVLNNIPYCTHKEEISGLLEQLKELKG